MIYFIECSGRIKIGFSLDAKARLHKVAADAPFPCKLLGVVTGDRNTEAEIQEKWAHLRRNGEWFVADEELRLWVSENAGEQDPSISKRGKGAICSLPIKRGLKKVIAHACGVTPGAVTQWQKVPAEHCQTISKITGIAPSVLRPDVFRDTKGEAA